MSGIKSGCKTFDLKHQHMTYVKIWRPKSNFDWIDVSTQYLLLTTSNLKKLNAKCRERDYEVIRENKIDTWPPLINCFDICISYLDLCQKVQVCSLSMLFSGSCFCLFGPCLGPRGGPGDVADAPGRVHRLLRLDRPKRTRRQPSKSTFSWFLQYFFFTRLFHCQVWSLSILEVSCQVGLESSLASLLMTSLMALANEGLFELTRRPSLRWAVSSSFTETTEVVRWILLKYDQN